ncbi:MAG: glycosyltransferase, partial [Patescibacteria group bacterium]
GKIIPLWVGINQDLVQIYNSATLYVQPSLAEGFGLPVLEAMACGCPVLSSRVGSLAEIGGKADLKFSPENLTRCWQSTALRLKLSHQGIAQAKHFSWRKTAQETLKIYEQAL